MIYRLLSRTSSTLLLFAVCTVSLPAQDPGETFKSPNFPVPFGPNNVGREFYFSFPANAEWEAGRRYIKLHISSGVATRVEVYIGDQFKTRFTTVPNDIKIVELSPMEGQAFVITPGLPIPDDRVYRNKAVRVIAEDPIIVYGMNSQKFTSDGFLALPVNALGREYIVATAASNVPNNYYDLPSQYMIIAPYDGTRVSITHPDTKNTEILNESEERISIALNKGDVFSAMSVGFKSDLSGTVIVANKPITVTAGQNCTFLPDETYWACDHIVEMLTPVESWGKFYQAMPIQGRIKGDTYRIFAGEPGAEVMINGNIHARLTRVGGAEGLNGWFEYRAGDRGPIEFSSNKRIFVAQYNNSQEYDNSIRTDPFYMILTPVEQYQNGFLFSTPDPIDFPQNFINLIGDSGAIFDAEITKVGSGEWKKVVNIAGNILRTFDTKLYEKTYVGLTAPISSGVHRVRTTGLIAGYVYGTAEYDSYGYPLSVATANLVLPDVNPPLIEGEQECDGTVRGTITDFPDDATIRTNLSTVELGDGSFNYKLELDPSFISNSSRATSYTLKVIDRTQDALAIIVASDAAGNVSSDTVRYFVRNITIEPDPLDFGEVFTGTSPELPVSITNNGERSIDIKGMLLQDGGKGFYIVSPEGGFTLVPGTPQEAIIRFDATVEGPFVDSIGVEDDCGLLWLSLTRAETVKPIIYVTDKDWGDVLINQPVDVHEISISNIGTGTLRIEGGTEPTDPVFMLPDGLPAFPLELKGGELPRTLLVGFRPTTEGTFKDSVVFQHNAPYDPKNDPVGELMGVGIDAALFATSANWGRKRVGTGPYFKTVTITNNGEADANVFGIKRRTGNTTDFDFVDEDAIRNVTVPPNGGTIKVGVSFSPTEVGERRMTVIFNTGEKDDTTLFSRLTGTGVVPGLGTHDLDFGSMNLGDPESPPRTVAFFLEGDDWTEGDWRDTVRIDNFIFVTDDDGFGNDDFRYKLPPDGTKFPIVLIPNENDSITITGYFSAKATGFREARLLAETGDDGVDALSRWTGRGTVQNAAIEVAASPAASLCLGEADTISVTIENKGSAQLKVTEIELDSDEFTLLDPPEKGETLTIMQDSTNTLKVQFLPVTGNGPREATIKIKSNDPARSEIDVPLTGFGSSFDISGELSLIGTHEGGAQAVLGEDITATVWVNDLPDDIEATGYKATLTYDPNDLFEPTSVDRITLNPLVHSEGVVSIDGATTRGRLILNVQALLKPSEGSEKLFSVPFGVLFNTNLKRSIYVDVEFNGRCVVTDIADATIDVNPICGLNLRLIELTSAKYTQPVAVPNPVAGGTVEIEYGLGLDGETRLTLFDASGNQIATLVDQYQQPGLYRVGFDTRTLPTGLYYCRMVSGHKEFVSPIVISN